MAIYLYDYQNMPGLTIEEAFVRCYNDVNYMHHCGIWAGKRHESVMHDYDYLSKQLIDLHLRQSGYDLGRLNGCKAYVVDNDA